MDVVFDASDLERWRIHVLAGTCKIGVHLLAESFVLQEWDSILRRPDEMEVDLRKGLGHRESPEVYNPVGVEDDGVLLPRVALRLPWALSYNPFGVTAGFS